MGRVYNPNKPGKEREHLLKLIKVTINEIHDCQVGCDDYKDLASFLSLTLNAVSDTVSTTTAAWEKRGYWLKADRFRLEWSWIDNISQQIESLLRQNDWEALIKLTNEMQSKLVNVPLLKKHRFGKPWVGAYEKYYKP